MSSIEQAADMLQESETVVALIGAGLSTPSGMPTYANSSGQWRNTESRNWTERDYFNEHPRWWFNRFWKFYNQRNASSPSVGHYALKDMVDASAIDAVITQNIDGYEIESGISEETVIEAHGSYRTMRCTETDGFGDSCGFRISTDEWRQGNPARSVPLCPDCKPYSVHVFGDKNTERVETRRRILKPEIMLYGELLESSWETKDRIDSSLDSADALIVIGTSLHVMGWRATVRRFAEDDKKTVVVINPNKTSADDMDGVTIIQQPAEVVVPGLRDLLIA